MAKRLEQLSKEAINWKKKFENSNISALTLAKEKLDNEKVISTLTNKVNALEKLCRALRSQGSASTTPEREIQPTVPASLPPTAPSDPPINLEQEAVSSTSAVPTSDSTDGSVHSESKDQIPSAEEGKSKDSNILEEESQPHTQENGDVKECNEEKTKQEDQ
jgi:hypothetical protein